MAVRKPSGLPSQRQSRVAEEIRHTLAAVFQRGDFRDPELAMATVTVTEVRISPDLRNATVFYMPLGGKETPELREALKRVRAYLRGVVAKELRLRVSPDLHFQIDTTFDEAGRIDALLRDPRVLADVRAEDEDEDAPEGEDAGDAADDKDDAHTPRA